VTEITPYNLIRHELIGLKVRIVQARESSMKGISGVVVDETRNMLVVDRKASRVMIPKNIATFRFKLPGGVQVDVDGDRLIARPENRLKTRVRRW
jgi:ribonuclease P protein subunit POP4